MKIFKPITIQPPSFTQSTGEIYTYSPITLKQLDITIIDNANRKTCLAQIRPCPRPLILWEKDAYIAAGDYTQAQVEARVTELLGNDPAKTLEKLFVT